MEHKNKIFILIEVKENVQLDYMKRYPRCATYVFTVRDFCDATGKIHNMIDVTGWS